MDLTLVSFEGVVYRKDDGYHVDDTLQGDTSLTAALRPLIPFTIVEFLGQHFPEAPLLMDRWGGGSCMWESTGKCPCGHHERPGYLFQFRESGKLELKDSGWFLGGKNIPLDLFEGHRSRIVVVPKLTQDDMLNFSGDVSDLKGILEKITSLQDVFQSVKDGSR